MTLEEVIEYYKTGYRFRELTGMSHVNLIHWRKKGFVPYQSQLRIEKLTQGRLKAGDEGSVEEARGNYKATIKATAYVPNGTPYSLESIGFHPAGCCLVHTGTDLECKD